MLTIYRRLFMSAKRLKDYYKVLGVSKTATPEEIKVAYYRMAKLYHPDTSQGSEAEARFQDIAAAYKTLTDPLLRSRHLLEILREKHSQVETEDSKEAVNTEFAMEIMELNEEIEECKAAGKQLEQIWARIESEVKSLMEQLDSTLESGDIDGSQRILNRISYLNTSKRLAEKKMGMDVD